jgi:hypothetical protein
MATKKAPANKKKFTPEMAEIILELGRKGASQKSMYAAVNISKSTAAKWKEENPEFAEVMSMATTYGQAFWENMMLANVDNKAFNSRVAELALKGQYPDDYGQQRIDLKANVKQEVTIDFDKEIAELMEMLK